MFTDIHLSKTFHENFKSSNQGNGKIELNINVLSIGIWPSSSLSLRSSCALLLPQVIVDECVDPFTAFYLHNHSGRKLTWQHHLCNASVRGTFKKEKRDFGVSTYQMCILMMFNEIQTIHFTQIRDAVKISDFELKRHLLSLCAPKFRVLLESSKGKVIFENDTFSVNFSYTSKLYHVKIPLVSVKDMSCGGDVENSSSCVDGANYDEVPSTVMGDRRHVTETAIVRIMKARKVLSHNDLIAEVLRQVSHRFSLDVPLEN